LKFRDFRSTNKKFCKTFLLLFSPTSFQAARALCGKNHLLRMELLSRMLHALASYCNFDAASSVFNELYSAGKDELASK
jgi:pentatricopeptide repeat protein